QRAEKFLSQKPQMVSMIMSVGQVSGGTGAMETTNYKSEINIELVEKSERKDDTKVYAARLKRELEKELVGAKVTTVPVGFMGAEMAPLQMTVTGSTLADAMAYSQEAEKQLRTIDGSSELKL